MVVVQHFVTLLSGTGHNYRSEFMQCGLHIGGSIA